MGILLEAGAFFGGFFHGVTITIRDLHPEVFLNNFSIASGGHWV
jgi:hypothetical protein